MGDAEVTASNWRLVEVGRVGIFAKGQFEGKIVAIVQIIDHKRVLVEGPSSDPKKAVPRHAAALSQLSLANIVIPKVIFGTGHTTLKKQWDAYEVESKWENGAYAKNQAKFARRKQLSDFERFKVMALRKQARFEVRKAMASAKA
nr:60s ribosomal protein l14-a [Quercus suber]